MGRARLVRGVARYGGGARCSEIRARSEMRACGEMRACSEIRAGSEGAPSTSVVPRPGSETTEKCLSKQCAVVGSEQWAVSS